MVVRESEKNAKRGAASNSFRPDSSVPAHAELGTKQASAAYLPHVCFYRASAESFRSLCGLTCK